MTADFKTGFVLGVQFSPFKGSDASFDMTVGGNVVLRRTGDGMYNLDIRDPDNVGAVSIAGRLFVDTAMGISTVMARTEAALSVGKDFTILNGDGKLTCTLTDVHVGGKLMMRTGGSKDIVTLAGVIVDGTTLLDTGAGLDALTISGGTTNAVSTFAKPMMVKLGADDDSLTLNHANIFKLLADGQAGLNLLTKDDPSLTFTVLPGTFLHFV